MVCHALLSLNIQVTVYIGSGLDIGVAHPLLNILKCEALVNEETGTGVAKFVETNMRKVVLF